MALGRPSSRINIFSNVYRGETRAEKRERVAGLSVRYGVLGEECELYGTNLINCCDLLSTIISDRYATEIRVSLCTLAPLSGRHGCRFRISTMVLHTITSLTAAPNNSLAVVRFLSRDICLVGGLLLPSTPARSKHFKRPYLLSFLIKRPRL